MFPDNGNLPVSPCSLRQQGTELYSDRFQTLIYWFHHDYNQIASETLGMISDHVNIESGGSGSGKLDHGGSEGGEPVAKVAEWSWENDGSKLTLRWHGTHVGAPQDPEKDLLIASTIPSSSWSDVSAGITIAIAVILAIGLIVWALARRIFLFDIAPWKMTGELRLAEAIREGQTVLILASAVTQNRPMRVT
jgi:hypothetical protein